MRLLPSLALLLGLLASPALAAPQEDVLAALLRPPAPPASSPVDPVAYTGSCGGWVRDCDSNQTRYECDPDERPICGECGTCDCYYRSECD